MWSHGGVPVMWPGQCTAVLGGSVQPRTWCHGSVPAGGRGSALWVVNQYRLLVWWFASNMASWRCAGVSQGSAPQRCAGRTAGVVYRCREMVKTAHVALAVKGCHGSWWISACCLCGSWAPVWQCSRCGSAGRRCCVPCRCGTVVGGSVACVVAVSKQVTGQVQVGH